MGDSSLSLWSEDSLLSIASKGSILSIGSVGSAGSIGSIGSVGSAFSVGSFASAGSVLSSLSVSSLLSHDGVGTVMGEPAGDRAGLIAAGALLGAAALILVARANRSWRPTFGHCDAPTRRRRARRLLLRVRNFQKPKFSVLPTALPG
jgi:hypothetical protein